jgi:hypothetical protein
MSYVKNKGSFFKEIICLGKPKKFLTYYFKCLYYPKERFYITLIGVNFSHIQYLYHHCINSFCILS